MINNDNITGNISTIAVWLWMILSPYISDYITQDIFIAILGLLIAIWSSANPNTFKFLNNHIKQCNCKIENEETVLNDEYETPDREGGC